MIKQIKQKSEKKFFVVHWGWIKLWLLFCSENLNRSDESLYKGPSSRSRLPSASSLTLGVQSQHLSASNPDLSALSVEESIKEFPDMVVKVYKADQTFKYLAITKVSIGFIHWYISCLKLIKVEFFSRNEKYKPLFTNVNLQDTNAREVVLLALQEFGITEPSRYTQCLNLPEFSNIHCTITLLTNDKNCKYLIDWYLLAFNEKKKLFC